MTPARWIEVKALFQRAVDLDPAARADCLAAYIGDPAVCSEVRTLLAADAVPGALDRSALFLLLPRARVRAGSGR